MDPAHARATERVELICSLLAQCNLQEQLEVRERLDLLVRRDFLSCLPPEVVACVLTFLSPEDTVRCLRVCRQWRRVVLACSTYWKALSASAGIRHEAPLSWSDLALAGLRRQRQIASGVCDFRELELGSAYISDVAEPTSSSVVIFCDQAEKKLFLSVRRVNEALQLQEEVRFPVSRLFKTQWCSASDRHVIIYGNNGEWIRYQRNGGEGPAISKWAGEIQAPIYFSFGCCSFCPLVAVIRRAPSNGTMWNLHFLKLCNKPISIAERIECPFHYLPDETLRDNVFFKVRKVALLSSDDPSTGFCSSHTLLIQIGACIVVHRVSPTEQGGLRLQLIKELLPIRDDPCPSARVASRSGAMSHVLADATGFVLSCDSKLLGLVAGCRLYTLDLNTFDCIVTKKHADFQSLHQCLAVGWQFSVLHSQVQYATAIVSTATGDVLWHTSSKQHLDAKKYRSSSPVHQSWLNTVQDLGQSTELLFAIDISHIHYATDSLGILALTCT